MVYEETFLRNFRFYAKTLTKLHDLTVLIFQGDINFEKQVKYTKYTFNIFIVFLLQN